jgi:hypothetical protein
MSVAPAAVAPVTETAYDRLMATLGLSPTDLKRLQDDDVTVLELMTEKLRPIAWKHDLESRPRSRHRGPTPPDPADECQMLRALVTLADDVYDASHDSYDGYSGDGTEVYLKRKLPQWMTWAMLKEWVIHIEHLQAEALAESHPTSQHSITGAAAAGSN